MTQKRRGAIWGYGSHARRHLIPALFQSRTFELVAVASRQCASPERRNIDGHDVYFCGERDMLSDPTIDTIYVSTPTGLHYEHCRMALSAGKNVLCEKSLTTSLEDTCDLLALARQRQLFMGEAFMYLFHPQYRRLFELVSSGQLGSIRSLTCDFGLPQLDEPGFRHTASLGGGAFWDVASYAVSIVGQLLGAIPDVLYASLEAPGEQVGVDTGGYAVLRVANSHASLSWGYGRSYRNQLTVWGDRGAVAVDRVFSKRDDFASSIAYYDQRGSRTDIDTGAANAFVHMLNDVGAGMERADYRESFLQCARMQATAMDRLAQRLSLPLQRYWSRN